MLAHLRRVGFPAPRGCPIHSLVDREMGPQCTVSSPGTQQQAPVHCGQHQEYHWSYSMASTSPHAAPKRKSSNPLSPLYHGREEVDHACRLSAISGAAVSRELPVPAGDTTWQHRKNPTGRLSGIDIVHGATVPSRGIIRGRTKIGSTARQ